MGDVAARRERADRHIVIEVADVHEAEPEHLREQRGIAAHDRQSQETERQQIERAVGQSGPGEADQRRGKPVASREHGGVVDLLVDVDQQQQIGQAAAAPVNDQRIALVAEREGHEGMRVFVGYHRRVVRQQD